MKKNAFIKQLAEFCEFSETDFSFDTKLKSIDGYDSMAIMSMIAFVDENFSIKITATQINALSDFNSLMNLLGKEKFEDD
ncbi:MAG: phosphopantetheine-binding protein [Bacteroidetes bacterium]|nr:phosphopantetheine-binding protein [Bacteroidota bacterium]